MGDQNFFFRRKRKEKEGRHTRLTGEKERIQAVIFLREESVRVLKERIFGAAVGEISPCFRGIRGCCLERDQSVF